MNELKVVLDIALELEYARPSGLGEVRHAVAPQVTKVEHQVKHLNEALLEDLVLEQAALEELDQELLMQLDNLVNVSLGLQFEQEIFVTFKNLK